MAHLTCESNWARLDDGAWGLRVVSTIAVVGDTLSVTRKLDGKMATVKLLSFVKSTVGGVSYWKAEETADVQPPSSASVVAPSVEAPSGKLPKTYDSMIKLVLSTLEANPAKVYRLSELVKLVAERVGYNETTTMPAIRGLVSAGIISNKGTLVQMRLQHKPKTVGSADAQAEVDELNKKYSKALVEITASYEAKLKESAAQIAAAKTNIHEVHLKGVDGETIKVTEGRFHPLFKHVCSLVNAREEVFLWGPTGCGKSHICKQVAESLGLRFAFISCTAGMSEGQIGGRLLPVGKNGTFEYVISEFVDCYENGGIFLLDEVDAADANVLLLINSALANGHMAVSNRPKAPYAVRHPDFVCMAAANTVGTGADRMYSGRNKLDAAFMERFGIGKTLMGYDEAVETELCPDTALRNQLLKYRKAILEHRLERAMSTRFMIKSYKMVTYYGWVMDDVDRAFFSGWRDDEVNKVKGGAK